MKTMKYLSMLLAMMVMSICWSSCSDDDSDDSETVSASIIGSWSQVNDAGTIITLKFNANKTGTINYTYSDGSGDSNENFEYDYIEKDRSLTIIGSQLAGGYYVTLTATKLIVSNNNEAYEFTKVR